MRHLISVFIVSAILLGCPAALLAGVECEGWGSIRGIRVDGQLLEVRTDVRVPRVGWNRIAQAAPWTVRDVRFSMKDGRRTYAARLPFGDNEQSVNYEQIVEEMPDGAVRVNVEVKANDDLTVEGAFVFITVRVRDFAGGRAELLDASQPTAATMPAQPLTETQHFLGGQATGIRLTSAFDAAAKRSLELHVTEPLRFSGQDNRKWNNDTYSFYFPIHSGKMAKGQVARASYTLRMTGAAERTPARLTLDAAKPLYRFDGFGGSFVYGSQSPVSLYNLDHLRVAWSRVWMPLHQWEPDNDNDSPAQTDFTKLEANDRPGTDLHNSLTIAAELQKRKIPYVISIWPAPKWLLANPWNQPHDAGRQIAPDRWDELCESIGSYLVYAKRQYGAEPQLFSFNEPEYGVTVKLTPDEHREVIKRLGAHFERLGLKTRLLLGDVSNPRDTAAYIAPAAADPQAMKYVGAMAFHSWGGATAQQYAQWAQAAQRLNLPLLVAEVGLDAAAWHYPQVMQEHWYALEEAAMYQQLLLHARPQALIEWECSSDYGIADVDFSQNPPVVKPNKRFWQLKQFGDLIPPRATALATASDNPEVLFTAFTDEQKRTCTLHLVNLGPSRQVTINGLPAGIGALRVYVTDESRDMGQLPTAAPKEGTLEMELPARAIVTLTDLPD